ncbi:MAG TPA: HAD-IB family hydrolase [Burkholderiales bacterium]|nr:HAD-IB family hydrolase [Burkholderiales bacterium]
MVNNVADNNSEKVVAYFDFDGTITTHDTLVPFLIYVVGWKKFLIKLPIVGFIALMYILKIITNEQAKQKTLIILIKGYSKNFIDAKAKEFAKFKLDKLIKPDIYYKIEYHLEHGHSIILISANLAIYLKYWAQKHKLNGVIATEIEFIDDKCTGKLATRNCYGKQKVLRLKEFLEENQDFNLSYSYGYGNSKGDYELLNYVNEAYWINGSEIVPWIYYK